MYDIKQLYEATSAENAVELLMAHPGAHVIAGGSDVLIKMRDGKLAGCELVSIYMLNELRGVTMEADGTIRIGALTSFTDITNNPIIEEHISVLGYAVDQVGSPQIRNIGTIGGNTCNGMTSADSASTLVAYDVIMEILGANGKRTLSIRDWYIKAGVVALEPGEILTAILIPKSSYDGYKGNYYKYGMRNALDIATCGCSVNVKLSEDKSIIKDARIAFGVASPVPCRALSAEAIVSGKPFSMELASEFAKVAMQDINPRTSWRASKDFRVHMLKVMAKRCFVESVRLSGGEI